MKNFSISNGDIIRSISGIIYEQHPYHLPEDIDIIMIMVRNKLDSMIGHNGKQDARFKLFEFKTREDLTKFIYELLDPLPEFHALNVSKHDKDRNISRSESTIAVTTINSDDSLSTRYTDFVDLSALIDNIVVDLIIHNIDKLSCFLCKHSEEYMTDQPSDCQLCKTCKCNSTYKVNHEYSPLALTPKNQLTEE